MKKIYPVIFIIMFAFFNTGKAQFVTIPDATFVTWLQTHGYSACLSGNQLDTTCSAVLTATTLSCNSTPIHNLSGLQYFKALTTLDCSNDSVNTIPALPSTLKSLNVTYNFLTALPPLPNSLQTLLCDYNLLSSLNTLPSGLKVLSCVENQINTLPALPSTLQNLICDYNNLSSLPTLPGALQTLSSVHNYLHTLPALPNGLQNLNCTGDSLSALPALPSTLVTLNCNTNQITVLPALSAGLTSLNCGSNSLTSLPALPSTLLTLYCLQNYITSLPALPASLTLINCSNNQLTSLPALPSGLQTLQCAFNTIGALPSLPVNLHLLDCSFNPIPALPLLPPALANLSCNANHLTSLPDLPASLTDFNCGFNQLTSIPTLPDSMHSLKVNYNSNLTCLPELKRIVTLDFSSTAVTCLPNYGHVTTCNPVLNTLPLCGIFNNHGCQPFWNISGQAYYDQNSDCRFDINDLPLNNLKAQLYSGGVLQQQVYTSGYGTYSFDSVGYGNYTVQIDTSNLPLSVRCPGNGNYAVQLSAADSVSYINNFAFMCKPQGFDVGVYSILNNVAPVPNSTFTLNTVAGDISQLYGANCVLGTAGNVVIIYNGPVTYTGAASGALTPTLVSGDTISWTIADFSAINITTAFNLLFKTNSQATSGSSVCFTVTVTPVTGDSNPGNNTLTHCLTVMNSDVSNEKEVSPVNNVDSSNPWLTYTIRFQNTTGTMVQNMKITDVLDSHLDPSTFQLLSYSAANLTQIYENRVIFNFPNIDLPDSATSDSASRGFVQYKIRFKNGLPVGTQASNTANIYMDSDAVIVTNTTTNTLIADTITGINQVAAAPFDIVLYPNPAQNYTTVNSTGLIAGSRLELNDAVGRIVLQQTINNSKFTISTTGLAKGIYLVRVFTTTGLGVVKKLILQ